MNRARVALNDDESEQRFRHRMADIARRLRRLSAAAAVSLLLLPLLPALRVWAVATFLYVDKGNASCSNTGTGSQAQPYCSISAAAAVAVAGQTVQVNSGTYAEQVSPKHAGVASRPIIFAAATGAAVTVTGGSHGFNVGKLSYITIQGFAVTQTSGAGIYLTNSSHIVVSNDHVSFAGQPVQGLTAHGISLSGTTSSTISGNQVDHNTDSGISLVTSSSGNDIAYNVGFNNAQQWQRNATGVDDRSPGNVLEYNVMHDNEDTGIQLWDGGDNAVVRNNVTYNNGDHGIDDHDAASAVIISNSVYRNCTSGINVEGTASNTMVENNIAVDNAVYPAYNNISCARQVGNIATSSTVAASTTANFNIVNLTTSGTVYTWGSSRYTSIQTMQTATGQEARGLQADPKWKSPSTWDLHIVGGSPAIDSADSSVSNESITDLDGASRVDDPKTPNTGIGPRTYDDRGAYEYQPPDSPPSAVLTVTPNSGSAPLAVTADGSGSTDIDSTPISTYRFDFGDGTVVGPQAGATAAHTYNAGGSFTVTLTVTDTAGLASQATVGVSVNARPTALLTVTPTSGETPLAVTADASKSTDSDATPISTYRFDFGDGSVVGPQPGATATHTYTTGGTFTVTVTVTDTGGLSSTAAATVTADAPPVAVIGVTPGSGATPLLVTADASGSTDGDASPISTYKFDFGDGTVVGPQAGAGATHSYASAGTFAITLTVTDSAGLSSTATTSVSANGAPSASLTVTPASGTAPLAVTADGSMSTDTDSTPISTYKFDFGDGTVVGPQPGATAAHTYSGTGNHTVTLTVTDTGGLTSLATAAVTVDALTASLSVNPASGVVPYAVMADASSSTDGDSTPISTYQFDFGDGTVAGPQGAATATHTYLAAGTYAVRVTVTDTGGLTAAATASVIAEPSDLPPAAALGVSPSSGMAPLGVTADASASTDSDDTPISSYTFDFGDGSVIGPQASPTAQHTYLTGGRSYIAAVTVTDSADLSSVATALVNVDGPPHASLSATPSSGVAPLAVTADASSSTDPDSTPISTYTFDFGDGTVVGPQAAATANHAYATGGGYTVTVTVTDTGGLTATATSTVTVDLLRAALSVTPGSGPTPLVVTADASSSIDGDTTPIASYSFDFGDGTVVGPQLAATTTHSYTAAGSYTVIVTVSDSGGLAATAGATVIADSAPLAALSMTPGSGSAPLLVTADASASTDPDLSPISSYTFDFGDSTVVGPQASPTAQHTYSAVGGFTASVTVTDTAGLTSTATAAVTVNGPDAPPAASLSVTPTVGAAPLLVSADASTSTDADWTPIATYKFDFGDGSIVGPQAAALATHTYAGAGNFTVVVTVTDSGGLSSTASASAVVDPLKALLTITPASGTVSLSVTADASGSTDPDSTPIVGYRFDFGDGTVVGPQNAATATHTYSSSGTYGVTLTVTDSGGVSATAQGTISADGPPAAALTISPSTLATNVPMTADASGSTDTDSTPIATYKFNFGDGTAVGPQSGATATHAYTVAGTYTITATVTDTAGYTGTATATIVVKTNAVANPGFESNTTGWNTSGSTTGVTLARATGGHSGAFSAVLTNPGPASASCVLNDSPNWVLTTAASTYTVSAWVKGAAATTIKIQIREYAGSTLVGQAPSAPVVISSTSWQLISATYTPAMPGSSTLDIHFEGKVNAGGTCYYIDDISEYAN